MLHNDKESAIRFAENLHKKHCNLDHSRKIELDGHSAETLEALFLGTHGGNSSKMYELMGLAIAGNTMYRNNYHPEDPDYLDEAVKATDDYKATLDLLETEYGKLVEQLQGSGTFFSMRSIGHMLWDTTMPGILGYFAALLYNQNNVAAEASPVTTLMEIQVGNELCKMLGYLIMPMLPGADSHPIDEITAWGHITCDGSVANLEGLWMARNLTLYPVSVRAALQNEAVLAPAKNFQVTLLNGSKVSLLTLDDWSVVNLPIDEILAIPDNLAKQYGIDITTLGNAISKYTVQNLGYTDILRKYLPTISNSPVSLCTATRHYSWPKGAAIAGVGSANMISVKVDNRARMDITHLEELLENCLNQKIPLLNVVVIIGSTEESAVDPLKEVLALREKFRARGLEFAIHSDAAWGGYYRTMLISPDDNDPTHFKRLHQSKLAFLPMSDYVKEQYEVLGQTDSITIDPHKSGYVPYPAGGLCYRNSAMRNLVAFTAPVVYHGGVDPTVGVYGVEGSKPGAAAAAVYLSHKVIRPNADGYGKLSGKCFFNSKRLYAALVCLNIENLPFFFVPLVPIPAIQQGGDEATILAQYEFIRDRIVNVTDEQLLADTEAFNLFKELGGDQSIITYMFNYYEDDGSKNTNLDKVNKLNDDVYRTFSFNDKPGVQEHVPELVVTSSSFTRDNYGDMLMDDLRGRLGVTDNPDEKINFIISTMMNPFLSNTVKGSFIPTIIEIMIRNLTDLSQKVKNNQPIIIS
ncbi:decarboxylase [Dokdonia sinensis]|uniref:Decarboxylase n=1 Tax=Dokdonia sinensis TaxID=2479847 RepID=A0A3M0G6C5_9FLAO|nr:pyridoxal-dependent decarboxylase [Dokdonia sinensis]RMB60521.1 decarboxylase [Dokdonia sinensis]